AGRRGARPLAGLAPLAIWIPLSFWYYGSPVPHSVVAKAAPLYPLPAGAALRQVGLLAGHWTIDGPIACARTLLRWAGDRSGDFERVPPLVYTAAGAALTFWALSRWWTMPGIRRSLRGLALPIYLTALAVFYALSNPLILPWYVPLLQAPWLTVAAGAALGPPPRRPGSGRLRLAAAFLVLGTALASFLYHLQPSERSMLLFGATDARQHGQLEAYGRAAAWLKTRASAEATVAAAEIGVLGYVLDRTILDGCGLVTPAAVPFLPAPVEQRGRQLGPIPRGFVRAARPDYVVMLPAFGEKSLLPDPWFNATYEIIHEEPFLDEPLYRAVRVYRRRGAP
ncbi:MAG TPA: hypothetical protein VJV23_06935, partial [Candidatus Polarisedimenticolia bacterium]|nr:hypothetical protein [Candidatus Polarisedimenticolia bacterium]